MVPAPYTGKTTSQWQQPAVYVQLDPVSSNALMEGRMVKVIQDNPEAVAKSQTYATQSGTERNKNRSALLEPLTTMA